ncbi:hypothetical protein [Mycolicibacterium psychrotolerans]|nr:hypothetical protein [Mycolicibacterium psychrotolerans]
MATPGEVHQRFHQAFESAALTVEDLWLRYFALGGVASRFELEAYLNGALALPPLQHDIVAHAINERLDEIAPPRAPYSIDFPEPDETTGT